MNEVTRAILAGVLRAVLAAASGYLIQHGILTADQAASASGAVIDRTLAVAPFVLAVAWSWAHKLAVDKRLGGWR